MKDVSCIYTDNTLKDTTVLQEECQYTEWTFLGGQALVSYQMTLQIFGISDYSILTTVFWFHQGTCKELPWAWQSPYKWLATGDGMVFCFCFCFFVFLVKQHSLLRTQACCLDHMLITLRLQNQICLTFPQIMVFDQSCLSRKASLKILILQSYNSPFFNTTQHTLKLVWFFSTRRLHLFLLSTNHFPRGELQNQLKNTK